MYKLYSFLPCITRDVQNTMEVQVDKELMEHHPMKKNV